MSRVVFRKILLFFLFLLTIVAVFTHFHNKKLEIVFSPESTNELAEEVVNTIAPGNPQLADLNITYQVKSGDTLYTILNINRVADSDISLITTALKRAKISEMLKAGQMVDIYLNKSGRVENLFIYGDPRGNIEVLLSGEHYKAMQRPLETVKEISSVNATISTSFYKDAVAAGATSKIASEFINQFGSVLDFQRDIRAGDNFVIKFEMERDRNGIPVRSGPIQYASITARGKKYEIYRFTRADGSATYVDSKGTSIRKMLLKKPINARITSGYGPRVHPIHGGKKMHKGVDYGALRGTPVMAAGDGVITFMKTTNRGYGKHLKIKHNGTYATLYGHLSHFAKGIKQGMRIRQGQVIGYVGASGTATGPHLHYEVHKNGVQVNPLKVTFSEPEVLPKTELQKFMAQKSAINKKFNIS